MPNPTITQATPTSPYTIANSRAIMADVVLTAGAFESRFLNLTVDNAATGLVIELVQNGPPVRTVAVTGASGSDATVPGVSVDWTSVPGAATTTYTITVRDQTGGGYVTVPWTLRTKSAAPGTWLFAPEQAMLLSRVMCDPVAVLTSSVVGAVPEKSPITLTAALATVGTVLGGPAPTVSYRFRSVGATAIPPLPVCSGGLTAGVTTPGVLRDSQVDLLVEVAFADCGSAATAWLRNTSPATTITIRPRPHQVAVLVDRSGSMGGARWRGAVAAARAVVRLFTVFRSGVQADDRVTLLAFEDTGCRWGPGSAPLTPTLLTPSSPAAAADAICSVPLGDPGSCTPIGQGLVAAMDVLAAAGHPADVRYALVMLTDGYENAGTVQVGPGTPPAGVQSFAVARTATADRSFVNQRLALFTVGLGSTVDEPVLNNLPAVAAGGGQYLKITDPTQLASAFGQMLAYVHEANPVATTAAAAGAVRFVTSGGADRLAAVVLAPAGTVTTSFRPAGSAEPFVAGPATVSCPEQDGVAVHGISVLDVSALGVAGSIEWEVAHSTAALTASSVLAYEDLRVNARLVLEQHAFRLGDAMEVTVHLRDGGEPITTARVTVEVVAPTEGLGEALTAFAPRYDPAPLPVPDPPLGKGHMVAALLRSRETTDLPTGVLTGPFVDGSNELRDPDRTGDYRNTFVRFDHEGTYTWRVTVDGVDTSGAPFTRVLTTSAWAGLLVDPGASGVKLTDLGVRQASGLTAVQIDVVPRDANGRPLGPFWDADVVFTLDVGRFEGSEPGEDPPPVLFDGSYRRVALYRAEQQPTVTVIATGTTLDPVSLPPGHIKDPPKDLPKDPPKDPPKDLPKDPPKDLPKDLRKDGIKDPIKDIRKEPIKDLPKDPPKDLPKDRPKDRTKELIKDQLQKERLQKENLKDIRDVQRKLPDARIEPDPLLPFTLATGPEAAGSSGSGSSGAGSASPELEALRPRLQQFARLHEQGLLGPDDLAAWQSLAEHAQRLLGDGS